MKRFVPVSIHHTSQMNSLTEEVIGHRLPCDGCVVQTAGITHIGRRPNPTITIQTINLTTVK